MKKSVLYARYIAGAMLVFLLFFGMGSAISAYVKASNNGTDSADADQEMMLEEQEGERTNILVLGVDARPGEDNSRSDTMLLVSIDPHLDQAVVISIPRDTRVNVPGSPLDKICTANFVGGPAYAVKIVEEFMDLNIDYYVEADFNGFKNIIDTIGGVSINVPQRMYKPSEGIDLYPGLQKLDGYQALAFVRYRNYQFGDIERTAHQQEFLVALADELLQARTIPKLPALLKETRGFVNTNLGIRDMLRIASWAPGFTASSVTAQTLPGYFYDVYNHEGVMEQSYWVADREEATGLLDRLFEGETVAVIQASPLPAYVPPSNEDAQVDEEDPEDERSGLPSPGNNDIDTGYDTDRDWIYDSGDEERKGHWEDEDWDERQEEYYNSGEESTGSEL